MKVETNRLQKSSRFKVLRQSALFSGLNDNELTELANIASEHSFMPGEFVFWEGDAPDRFYIVEEGQIKALKHSSLGRDFIIAFFSPGEMFGEVAVFENKPYPASAQAVVKTRVLGVNSRDFLSFLASHPAVALRIISILSGRLREAQNRLRDLAGERVEQRLYTILLMLSSKFGTTLPLTRKEIAEMAGTTTETTIRVLSRLRDGNIIRSTRGKIVILNETKVKLLSEGPPQI
jgi:CRP-like cAMP-binding protein